MQTKKMDPDPPCLLECIIQVSIHIFLIQFIWVIFFQNSIIHNFFVTIVYKLVRFYCTSLIRIRIQNGTTGIHSTLAKTVAHRNCLQTGVCHEIFDPTFCFHDLNRSGPLINGLDYFRFRIRKYFRLFIRAWTGSTQENRKRYKLLWHTLFSHTHYNK